LPDSYSPDGVSQLAALQGSGSAKRDKPLFWKAMSRWPARKTQPNHWVSFAVVSENWKLVTNQDGSYVELYDLVADGLETSDLSKLKPEVTKSLVEKIEAWKRTLPEKPSGNVFSSERIKSSENER
jgi:hypothetical protein